MIIIISSFNHVKNRMVSNPASTITKSIFTPAHDSLIRTAYNMFLDKPLVGHGPKMFRVICKDEKYATRVTPCMTHPHNFYVQLLAETGIIGFSFLFSVFVYVLYCAYRQFKSIALRQKRYLTDYQVCLLAGILITVWPLTTNSNFFNNWLMIVYSLPVGFYLHSIYGKNRENISF
jgi:O-antigen ligase